MSVAISYKTQARQVRQCLSALLVLLGGKRSAAALGEWDLWIHSSVEKTY